MVLRSIANLKLSPISQKVAFEEASHGAIRRSSANLFRTLKQAIGRGPEWIIRGEPFVEFQAEIGAPIER
jgi:hypothetical protein